MWWNSNHLHFGSISRSNANPVEIIDQQINIDLFHKHWWPLLWSNIEENEKLK